MLSVHAVCLGQMQLRNSSSAKKSEERNEVLDGLRARGFEIRYESHAAAILEKDFPAALDELEKVLMNLTIPVTEIIGSGGGETKGTQRMRHAFDAVGWRKFVFEVRKIIN